MFSYVASMEHTSSCKCMVWLLIYCVAQWSQNNNTELLLGLQLLLQHIWFSWSARSKSCSCLIIRWSFQSSVWGREEPKTISPQGKSENYCLMVQLHNDVLRQQTEKQQNNCSFTNYIRLKPGYIQANILCIAVSGKTLVVSPPRSFYYFRFIIYIYAYVLTFSSLFWLVPCHRRVDIPPLGRNNLSGILRSCPTQFWLDIPEVFNNSSMDFSWSWATWQLFEN